jgi:hypothetical protein
MARQDFDRADVLQELRFGFLAGDRHDMIAAGSKHIDGEACHAAGSAVHYHLATGGAEIVLLHQVDAECRGIAGGADGHRIEQSHAVR